jgi:hypothetical protein
MKKNKKIAMYVSIAALLIMAMGIGSTWAMTREQWEKKELPTFNELMKEKNQYDDPAPILKTALNPKNYLPPEVYKQVTFDVETMKKVWADSLGFKSPDIVGKIAPEIKPGVYTYKDKDKYPGLKDLMIPFYYNKFAPGAPPFCGNFPEIKVVPTRQYYLPLPYALATKDNEGKTKMSENGYLIPGTYVAGLPFPRPSGQFKVQQIVNNHQFFHFAISMGQRHGWFVDQAFNKKLEVDWVARTTDWSIYTWGRVIEPKGWFDERARKQGERAIAMAKWESPQDSIGNAFSTVFTVDPDTSNQTYFYFNQMRRIRKMSAEDTQDVFPGTDSIIDDAMAFMQKLSPKRFPYKYELIAEREYLIPTSWDGSVYFTSKNGVEMRNAEWERRPVYVVRLTSLDPNYIYRVRILYVDKEHFEVYFVENYDKKGRLFRTMEKVFGFYPEQGMLSVQKLIYTNQVDTHSSVTNAYMDQFATNLTRDDVNIGRLMKAGGK